MVRRSAGPVEPLESRQLLAASVLQPTPAVTGAAGASATIDVSQFIGDPTVNSKVRFSTAVGNIDLELFDQQKPITVNNFLRYVREGRYNTTIVHRATNPETGIEVIQGGGFLLPIPLNDVPAFPPIENEAPTSPILSNTQGTIAMGQLSGNPDSATSEWFINSVDNTALDPGPDPSDEGYAVFGQVINNTLPVVTTIQDLPTFNLGSPFGEIPLRNYSGTGTPTNENLVSLTAETLPELTFQVTSSNPAVAAPTLSGNRLTLAYGTAGTSDITITGTDAGGQSVTQTFTATVTGTAPPPPPPGVTVNLGTGGAQSVTFTDGDGTVGTITLKGPGTAAVTLAGTGLTQAAAKNKATVTGGAAAVDEVTITGASAATAVTVTAKGGNGTLDVAGLTADSALKSLAAKTVNLTGPLNVAGGVGKLDLGSAANTSVAIGGGPAATVTFAGDVAGTAITSAAPLKSLAASAFTAGTTPGTITAPSIDRLTTRGALAQDVAATGTIKAVAVGGDLTGDVTADAIGALAVRGAMTGSTVSVTRPFAAADKPLGKVTVGGAVTGSTIRAAGNITSVTAGSMSGSAVYAGVAPAVPAAALPDDPADFASQATIGSITVKGATTGSNVAAFNMGRVNVGALTTANNGTPFGVAAGRIATLTGSAGGPRLSLRNLDTQADVTAGTGGANLQDFRIVLV